MVKTRVLHRTAALCLILACVGLLCASAGTKPQPEPVPEPQVFVLRTVHAAAEPTARFLTGGMAFAPEEADGLTVLGTSPHLSEVYPRALLTAPYSVRRHGGSPCVLIVHTHTTEAYSPTDGYRSEDPAENIVRVGEALAEALTARGIGVIHNKTVHDQPSFAMAYSACLDDLTPILEENPSICAVLDIHRDAYAVDGVQQAYLADGDTAQLLLVCGDGGNYDYNGWQSNLNWAVKLYAAANRREPELIRALRLDHARYNQHILPGALLIEVGAAGNTLPQAISAAQRFGAVLAEVLQALPEEAA